MSFSVVISHSVLKNFNYEKLYQSHITVGELKQKLHFLTGTPADNMILQLKNSIGSIIKTLQPDDATLQQMGFSEISYVHVVDLDPEASEVSIMAKLDSGKFDTEKYEIDFEEYKKRPDSFYQWKQVHLKDYYANKAQQMLDEVKKTTSTAKEMKVGMRCECGSKEMPKRGVVKYIGKLQGHEDIIWIGVHLDEPYGKHDGTFKKRRYFEAPDKYGLFCKAHNIQVGDFPMIDEFDDSSDDSDVEL